MSTRNSAARQIPERWLYWTFQRRELLKPDIFTAGGRPLKIIFPGFRNTSDGPDFFDAVIEIGGTRYSGDVEFHRTAEEWYRHGHHQDPRYRRVILHVLWECSGRPAAGRGPAIPRFSIRAHLKPSLNNWRQKMQYLDTNYGFFYGAEIGSELDLNYLETLAWQRFQRKADRVREWSRFFSFGDLLFVVLAEVLGYRHNQQPMRQLLWNVPPSKIYAQFGVCRRSPEVLWSYLLHCAGLKAPRMQFAWRRCPPGSDFRDISPVFSASDWQFRRVRPLNHPHFRLAAIAFLLYRYQQPTLFEELLDLCSRRLPIQALLPSILAVLGQPYPDNFQNVLAGGRKKPAIPRHVMGRQRIHQFLVNAMLPLFYVWAEKTANPGFRSYLGDLYFQCPACESSNHFRKVDESPMLPAVKMRVRRFAAYQQGILEYLTSADRR